MSLNNSNVGLQLDHTRIGTAKTKNYSNGQLMAASETQQMQSPVSRNIRESALQNKDFQPQPAVTT
jgi:hypothetical protein